MTVSKKMIELEKILTQKGHEITLPEFTYDYAKMGSITTIHTESVKNKKKYGLIKNYFDKIKKHDAILVVNEERKGIKNYIGGNTFLEIGFAYILEKKIFIYNSLPNLDLSEEIESMQPIILNQNLDLIN